MYESEWERERERDVVDHPIFKLLSNVSIISKKNPETQNSK